MRALGTEGVAGGRDTQAWLCRDGGGEGWVWVGSVGQAPGPDGSAHGSGCGCRPGSRLNGSWHSEGVLQAPWPVWPRKVASAAPRGVGEGPKQQGPRSACLKRLLVFRGYIKRPRGGRAPRLGTVRAC